MSFASLPPVQYAWHLWCSQSCSRADDKTPMQGKNDFMQLQTIQRPRRFLLVGVFLFFWWSGSPSIAQEIPKEPLEEVTQLTSGFARAGEGYFSPDMKWIIFQAVPQGEEQYQMYLAKLHITENQPAKIDAPIRISPENSRNTCGYFSPDGKSLIFASTTGKENPDEPTSGYQREGRDYRWSYPTGMEIFRADNWLELIQTVKPDEILNLATHPLTSNDAYDAECALSPDGKWIC